MARGATPALLLTVLLLAVPAVSAGGTHLDAHGDHPDGAYSDHPDPGVSASFSLFPGPDDVQAGLDKHADHPWVTLHDVGTSESDRTIRVALVTDPGSEVPLEDRVVTFLFTQQHGNEPAGTPAALQLLDDITAGKDIAKTLSNQVLLLLPMANPDGAAAEQRANKEGIDINRDHMSLETTEANAIHNVLNQWEVHVAMDHHEYGGIGFGNPVPVRVYDYDLTTMHPRHGNVRDPTMDMSQELMYDGIWPKAEADGFSANEYGEQTAAGVPVQEVAGGPDPGIMRNHLGLHHVTGLLVETRVDAHPNPFHDALRRQLIHSSVMEATLEYVSKHAERFIEAQQTSLALDGHQPMTRYIEGGRVAKLAAAYAVAPAEDTSQLFERHGLDAGVAKDDQIVHNVHSGFAGHVAALLHPSSSRAVADGVATAPVVVPDTTETVAETAPAVPALALVVGLLGLAGVLRRRV